MKMRKIRIALILAVALLLLIPAGMIPVFGDNASVGITVYDTPDFDDLEPGLKGHDDLIGTFAGNNAGNKIPSGVTVVKDPDPSHEGDQALQVSLEPAATGTKTEQDFVLFNNRVCYITWHDNTTTNSLGQTVYTGYFTDKGSENDSNERYGIQSTDNKATVLVVDQSHADDVNQDFAITSDTITYIRTTCTIQWDGPATTDLFGNRAYFGYFVYKDAAYRVKSTDDKASCIIIPKNAAYDVSNDAAVLEAMSGGENVYRNLLLAHDALSYADEGKVVLQAEYYIPTGCIGTFRVQQSSFQYYLVGSRDTTEKSKSWLNYYTIDTRAGELTVEAFTSSASGKTKISLEKDTWITVSLAIDLINGTMDVYVNNVLKDSGSFFVTLNGAKHRIHNITLEKNSWQLAKINVNQGYPANLRGEIYLDNAIIHQYDDSQKVVFGESTNAAGEPAIGVSMELASGCSSGAALTDTVLVNVDMTAEPIYLSNDLVGGLIAPLRGASIRLTGEGAIRFGTQANSAKLAILQKMQENGQIKDLQIGTLIAPASYVKEAGSFTKEALDQLTYSDKYLDVKATVGAYFPTNVATMTEGYDAIFDGVLLDIEPADFTRAFAGVGYVKLTTLDGTEHYFYSYEYDSATFEANYARSLASAATPFIGVSEYETYQDVLQVFRGGMIAVSGISDTTIKNVQHTVNYFFFQNTAGISMRLSYEGKSGWRFQAVQPADAEKPYDSFNNTGAGQSLALYMGESYGDVTTHLTVATGDGYIRVTEQETASYVDISTTGDFNVQFYSPAGEAMNNINGVSLGESDGLGQIILTGALKDASEEAIFGGGQRFDSANKRGLSLSLFTYDAYNTDGGKGTYTVIPLFMSTRGSGLFINRYERMIVDFDKTAVNQWTVALFNDLIDCYIYATGDMTDALDGYSNISGYAEMPAEWAQGVMVCRYNPDFGTLDGTGIYEKLSDIPGHEDLHVGSSSGELAMTVTLTKGTYLYQDGVRSYYYDGTSFYGLTKKGNPGGYGVRQVVESMIDVGMKPNVVIIEALDYAWLNCTNDSTTAMKNLQNIKEIADWLHENDIKLMLYMGIAQMSANLAGVKNEYYVRANITVEVDESVKAPHNYEDSYTRNTNEIIWSATSDNPDAIGTNTQKYLDITNPEAVDWYMNEIWGLLIDIGADGCKLDFCETMPNHVTPLKAMLGGEYVRVGTVTVDYLWHDPSVFGEGDVHHAYPTYFTALFYESMNQQIADKKLPKSFHINTRGGGIGIQRNIIMWGGDQTRREKNLSMHLLTMLNSGISGMPFNSYDMGGYAYDTGTGGYFGGSLGMTAEAVNNTESIIYLRALQFTAFTTTIQVHGDVRNVYELKLRGDYADDYVQTVNARYVELHGLLQDYMRKWSAVSCETGMPLVRHMALQYQDDPNTWDIDDQFMLGDAIMVAPIIKLYKYERDIYLPEGKWQNMLTGEVHEVGEGGMKLEKLHADLDQVPVFLNMESEDYKDLLEVFNSEEWQAINRGHVFADNAN